MKNNYPILMQELKALELKDLIQLWFQSKFAPDYKEIDDFASVATLDKIHELQTELDEVIKNNS